METVGKRIKSLRKNNNLTQMQVAKQVGVSGVSVGYWEKDLNQPNGQSLFHLSRLFGVSEKFILFGTDENESNFEPAPIGNKRVPLISYVQAGLWTEANSIYSIEGGFDYVYVDMDYSPNVFALRIKGQSMEPIFNEGDVVIIDSDLAPYPGDFVVAKNGSHEATFKKYRETGFDWTGKKIIELTPLNGNFAPVSSEHEEITIIGTMVEHRIYRRKR